MSAMNGSLLEAEVMVIGKRLRVDFYGMTAAREGTGMGANRVGITHTHGAWYGSEDAARLAAREARTHLLALGILVRGDSEGGKP